MTQIWIVWQSSGSYEDYHKSVHKVYKDELVALGESDRLNLELKELKEKYKPILHCNGLDDCDICERKVLCDEFYNGVQWTLEEWHDYTVEAFNVEGE